MIFVAAVVVLKKRRKLVDGNVLNMEIYIILKSLLRI